MRGRASHFIRLVPALAVGAAALVFASPVAHAATSGSTTGTFTLSSGSLSISAPATANLGSAAVGSLTLQGALGNVTVSDQRGSLADSWTTTVSSTSFTTGTATASETVATSNIAYTAGLPTTSAGSGAFTGGVLANLSAAGTAGQWAGTGVNTVAWNPTITFTLLGSQVAGTYTGTITHSVA